ncbi:FAD-binding protein [Corallococcus exiguus]|nr:FAD-binding protein [Corallococcus exiguus]
MQAPSSQVHPVPVLIVGGGLVGLSTALFLAHQGVRSRVIEKHAGTSLHPRARGFHARTVELLRSTCAREEVERAGSVPAGTVVGELVAVTLAGPVHSWKTRTVSTQRTDVSPCPYVFLGQDRMEPILLEAARSQGVEVRFRHELTGFTQDAQGVRATVLDREAGTVSTVHAAYLIGADGVRSPVREALGIALRGRGSFGHNISTLFDADLSPVRREVPLAFAVLTHPELGGVIAATDVKDRWSHATRIDVSREKAEDFTDAAHGRLGREHRHPRRGEPRVEAGRGVERPRGSRAAGDLRRRAKARGRRHREPGRAARTADGEAGTSGGRGVRRRGCGHPGLPLRRRAAAAEDVRPHGRTRHARAARVVGGSQVDPGFVWQRLRPADRKRSVERRRPETRGAHAAAGSRGPRLAARVWGRGGWRLPRASGRHGGRAME